MVNRKTLWAPALTFVAALSLVGAVEAKGNKGPNAAGEGKQHGLHGVIKDVAADGSSITVTTGGKKNPTDVVVSLATVTTVKVDGQVGQKSDLKVGEHVKCVGATKTSPTATEIDAYTKGHGHGEGKGKGKNGPNPA